MDEPAIFQQPVVSVDPLVDTANRGPYPSSANLLAFGSRFKMFSLNPREMLFLVAVFVATVVGASVKYWRDARREMFVRPAGAVAPAARIQTNPTSGKP